MTAPLPPSAPSPPPGRPPLNNRPAGRDRSGGHPAGLHLGWLLVGALVLVVGLGMLLIGVAQSLGPSPDDARNNAHPALTRKPAVPGAGSTEAPAEPSDGLRPSRPQAGAPVASAAPAAAALAPTPPSALRTWPGRLAIFSDTPFSDGRPMDLIQPIEWRPVLSLHDRGLTTPNPYARPEPADPAALRGQALPPDSRLYLTFSGPGAIVAAELRGGQLALLYSAAADQPMTPFAQAALLPVAPDLKGIARTRLQFQLRDGQLAVQQDGRNLCSAVAPCTFSGAMAWQTGPDQTLVFGDFELRSAGEILFRDDFMRADSDGFWKPVSGAWELESLTFPERSSNPFALKAVFSGSTEIADLDKNRELFQGQDERGEGAGIQLDVHDNRITVARITGDGAAARAGLMEEDVILALNGRALTFRDMMYFYREIRRPTTGTVDLEILRPGEARSRHIVFQPAEYHWADVRLHQKLPGSKLADRALIIAGQDSWSHYHALCAVRFLSAGGAGMVLGAGRPEAIEIRWYGANIAMPYLPANRLQIVKIGADQETILFERELTPWRDTFYRLHADTTGPDLKLYVDDVLVTTLKNLAPPAGPVGLWAAKGNLPGVSPADNGVYFDDVEVVSDPAQITNRAQMRINRIMQNEQDMKQWANPAHEWIATHRILAAADGRTPSIPVVQYRADIPGHQSLVVKTPVPAPGHGFSLYLGVPLPAPTQGTIPPLPADEVSARSALDTHFETLPRHLAMLGAPVYFPPGLDSSSGWGNARESVEARRARLAAAEPAAGGARAGAPMELPPLGAVALEWRFERATDGGTGWHWRLLDPQTAAPLATGDCAALPDALALICLAGKVAVRINGREAATVDRDLSAPVGQSVAVSGLDNWPDEGVLTASGDHVLEYTFNNAPDDWAVHAGRWGLLNKWVCDPRWSWFGGRSDDGLAAIWHKTRFSGDIAVDYYAALMMYQNDPPHERPGDFNCTLFGDGVNMGSGYGLIFAGGDNRWSALTRNGDTVEWTAIEAARCPSDRLRQQEKMALHQKWFHIQLRRVGGRVSYSLDGVQWLSFDDPAPLAAGRVALWTRNNGFLLARVRIAYEQSLGPVLDEGRTAPRAAEAPLAAAVSLKTGQPPPHSFAIDLTPLGNEWTSTAAWTPQQWPPQNELQPYATLRLVPSGGLAVRQADLLPNTASVTRPTEALTLTSPGGGSFAVGITPTRPFSFDPGHNRLRFWFRADASASVDLYFRTQKGNYFRVRLTGPEMGPPGTLELGDAGPGLADGRWHLIDLDLSQRYAALLRDRFIDLKVTALEVLFGALSPAGGQLWNVHCNPAGATYSLADVEVLPAAELTAWPTVAPAGKLDIVGGDILSLPLDVVPDATLVAATATRRDGATREIEIGPTAAIRRNADGLDWSLNLAMLRPWLADPADLQTLEITWQRGRPPGDRKTVALACKLPADPGFRYRGLRLRPVMWLAAGDNPPATETTPAAAAATGAAWIDAAPVNSDFGALPSNQTLADPPHPRNALITRPGAATLYDPFTGLAALRVEPRVEGQNWGLSVPLVRDQAAMQAQAATPRGGKMFRLIPGQDPIPVAGDRSFAGGEDAQAFNLARYPLLRIDHRTPFEAPVNLRAWSNEGSVSFMLTDRWAPFTWYLDDPSDFLGGDRFTDDGRWRSELIDLRAIWQRDRFTAKDANRPPWLQNLQLVDNGWPGARKGMFLAYGRVQAVPACRPDEFGVRLTDLPPAALDDNGAPRAGLRLLLAAAAPDQDIAEFFTLTPTDRHNPNAPAPQVYSLTAADREKIPSGVYWVYAVAAAEWQALRAEHDHPGRGPLPPRAPRYFDTCPVVLDGTAPAATEITPADGAVTSDTQVRFRLTDDNFLRADTVQLAVGDRPLKLSDPAVHFDPATGAVTIDLLKVWAQAGLPAQPTAVEVQLTSAADELGNRLTAPRRLTRFTVDPAQPQAAPVLAQWRCSNFGDDNRSALAEYRGLLHDTGFNRFEFLPGDGDFCGAGTAVCLTADEPGWGRHSLQARVRDPLGEFFTTLYEDPWFVDDRPVVLFDYRATVDAPLQLECEVDDRRVVVPLEGVAGRLLADGQWHHVAIDLATYLRARCPELKYYLARRLRIVQRPPRSMLAGAGMDIDNLALLDGPRAGQLQLNWRTADGAPPGRVLVDINNLTQPAPDTPLTAAQLAGETTIDVPFPNREPLYAHLQAFARNGTPGEVIHLKLWDLDLPLRRARQLGWLEK